MGVETVEKLPHAVTNAAVWSEDRRQFATTVQLALFGVVLSKRLFRVQFCSGFTVRKSKSAYCAKFVRFGVV